jgi:hypothetical protein
MIDHEWLSAPIGIDSQRWVSRRGCRTILVVVHTMATCHRLLDVTDLVESDPRIQVVFAVAPDVFNAGVKHHLQSIGAVVLPWAQATGETFDLAIAAAHGGLHQVHGPLALMAHGAGRAKLAIPSRHGGPALAVRTVYGLDAQRLARDGRVLASTILLAHDNELDILSRQCPEALDVAVVVGDICFDRLAASRPLRDHYRRALGVGPDQKLVVVSSTWGADGLFGAVPDLLPRMMDQLSPHRFRVAAVLHPAVWGAHGQRQIRAWLRDAEEAGMLLAGPADDWRAVVAAADTVIGDHGSVTAYAAAAGVPILAAAGRSLDMVADGSPQALAIGGAGVLDLTRSIAGQVESAVPVDVRRVAEAITSRPGQAARLVRGALYRLLGLPEPARHRAMSPAAVPVAGRQAR